jgi:hypothetical protein
MATNSTTTGQGVWTSGVIDITGKTNVSISVDTWNSTLDDMNNSGTYMDYLRMYYKLNGSSTETLFSEQLGLINNSSTTATTVSVGSLSGTSLQIVIKARATGDDEFYYFDNVKVTGTSQTITASASVNGTLSCTTTSVPLSGSSNATGTVTYSWTGPNGFTSSAQNPSVNAGGTYTLTVANSSGCSGTASVTVSQNITPPGASAEQCAIIQNVLADPGPGVGGLEPFGLLLRDGFIPGGNAQRCSTQGLGPRQSSVAQPGGEAALDQRVMRAFVRRGGRRWQRG